MSKTERLPVWGNGKAVVAWAVVDAAYRSRGGSSRYRGVCFHKRAGKWQAQAQLNGEMHYLGLHVTEDEAHAAAEAWRAEHMPFANPERAVADRAA